MSTTVWKWQPAWYCPECFNRDLRLLPYRDDRGFPMWHCVGCKWEGPEDKINKGE